MQPTRASDTDTETVKGLDHAAGVGIFESADAMRQRSWGTPVDPVSLGATRGYEILNDSILFFVESIFLVDLVIHGLYRILDVDFPARNFI